MNQGVKQGLLIVIGVLLIASLVALFKFYVTTPKGYFASTDDEVAYSKTPNDHFNEAKLPFPENLSDEKSPPSVPPSDKSPSASTSTRTSTERFSDDKSPTVVPSDDNVPSNDNSPTPSASNNSGNKPPYTHGSLQEPVVKEMNNTIKVDSPDELPQSIIDRVKTFVFFVGYARSGHSIVGSLMDSHPHMVISHEYDLFTKLSGKSPLAPNKPAIFNALWKNTKQTIINGFRAKSTNFKGYTLFVDGLYQGKYVDHIDVIGDKKGGTTAELLAYHHEKWVQSFNIVKSLNLPMKVVHVMRNPYDNIGTMILYNSLGGKQTFGDFKKSNRTLKAKSHVVDYQIGFYFALHKAIVDAKTTYNLDMIEIHGKDFISDPKGTLSIICSSLGVTCYDDYLEICYNKLYKHESRTRHLLEWTEEQLARIQENIDKYSDLKQYSFHSM